MAKHYVLVGDSLTMQYSPIFKLLAYPDKVSAIYWPGINPVGVDMRPWIRNAGRADVVVFQDEARCWCDMGGYNVAQYVVAVDDLAKEAHAQGAKFVVLDGTHPRVDSLADATFPMAPPDDFDQVHYLHAGAMRQAQLLLSQLKGLQ